jgi:hypothetical protein
MAHYPQVDLFGKYIAMVKIINQSINQSIKKVTIFWNDKEQVSSYESLT